MDEHVHVVVFFLLFGSRRSFFFDNNGLRHRRSHGSSGSDSDCCVRRRARCSATRIGYFHQDRSGPAVHNFFELSRPLVGTSQWPQRGTAQLAHEFVELFPRLAVLVVIGVAQGQNGVGNVLKRTQGGILGSGPGRLFQVPQELVRVFGRIAVSGGRRHHQHSVLDALVAGCGRLAPDFLGELHFLELVEFGADHAREIGLGVGIGQNHFVGRC
mmetsp:Transcript_23030/g.50239  ORF Transcript_23030/g.50239 Transcript_23030/m.50239 type:complete len:214 (+) Transcript_23030:1775-2416(+)